MAKIALGISREATKPDCIQALIVEFIVTFLYVFAGVGSAMAARILAARNSTLKVNKWSVRGSNSGSCTYSAMFLPTE
ncbi:aquaporin TIP4-1-like, partial [Trifolium medium]|nr:aquaporin TIP4-1-like [Trifolium medium]